MTVSGQFLKQMLEERQKRNPNFSLRAFARHLGMSPAQLSQLISGKRPLTQKAAHKISERLDLSPMERLEFMRTTLPDWLEPARKTDERFLTEDEFRAIADWHHFAILSLTKTANAKADPRWIAQRLGIGVNEAREGVDRLVRLGLVETKPKFRQVSQPLNVKSEDMSAAIRQYHRQNLKLAEEKIETVDMKLRDLQSITVATSPAKIAKVKALVDEFLGRLDGLMEMKNATEVYTVAVQVFPVTKIEGEGS